MNKARSYIDYLNDILEAINNGINFIEGIDFEKFKLDEKTQYALIRAIEIIGEASKKIPDELKSKYTMVSWREIGAIRDKLIHDYFGINEAVVWKTVKEDLPALKNHIENILQNLK